MNVYQPVHGTDSAVWDSDAIVDTDIHPVVKSRTDLRKYLAPAWREHFDTFGGNDRRLYVDGDPYPNITPHLSRRDTVPPDGSPPGSDLAFMREQLLDPHKVAFGILQPLSPVVADQRNQEYGAELCRAINDWQREEWTSADKRLKTSIVVPNEYPEAAIAEIDRCSRHDDFVQVSPVQRCVEPLGRRRYWPIFAAAAERGLPIGIHGGGRNGHSPTGGGWCSYQAEAHHCAWVSKATLLTSLVMEGVFEEFPTLKVVLVESGFTWVPPLCWRLDKLWRRIGAEVPHLKRPPSEYIREHVWYTTQPMDTFDNPMHLRQTFDWIGWDKLMFSSDYPHWDFDDPRYAFPLRFSDAERNAIFRDNARALYRLG